MAVGDALVFLGFLTQVLKQLSFQGHQILFSHASGMRGENTLERKFTSTGYQTLKLQFMSQTRSPRSKPAGESLTRQSFTPVPTECICR